MLSTWYPRDLCLTLRSQGCSPGLSSRSFIVLSCAHRSVIHFEIWGRRYKMGDGGGDLFFSACGCSVVLTSLIKKIVAEQIRWLLCLATRRMDNGNDRWAGLKSPHATTWARALDFQLPVGTGPSARPCQRPCQASCGYCLMPWGKMSFFLEPLRV